MVLSKSFLYYSCSRDSLTSNLHWLTFFLFEISGFFWVFSRSLNTLQVVLVITFSSPVLGTYNNPIQKYPGRIITAEDGSWCWQKVGWVSEKGFLESWVYPLETQASIASKGQIMFGIKKFDQNVQKQYSWNIPYLNTNICTNSCYIPRILALK